MSHNMRSRKAAASAPPELCVLIARGAALAQVEKALARGANPNAATWQGELPIHGAALAGRSELIAPLALAGARLNERGERGLTALAMAARRGDAETVAALIAHGADPDARADEGYPVHLAARSRRPAETLAALFAGGANPNVQDGNRRTYLHTALGGYLQTEEIPLPATLSPDTRDDRGERALTIALENRLESLAEGLLRLGADPEEISPAGLSPLSIARRHGLSSCEGLILALLDARELERDLGEGPAPEASARPLSL